MSNGCMRQVYICKDSNFSHKYTFCSVILCFIFEFYVLTVTNVRLVFCMFCLWIMCKIFCIWGAD